MSAKSTGLMSGYLQIEWVTCHTYFEKSGRAMPRTYLWLRVVSRRRRTYSSGQLTAMSLLERAANLRIARQELRAY